MPATSPVNSTQTPGGGWHRGTTNAASELLGAVHLGEIGRIALLWSCLTLEVRDWLDSDSCSAQVRVSRNFRGDPSLAVSLNPPSRRQCIRGDSA